MRKDLVAIVMALNFGVAVVAEDVAISAISAVGAAVCFIYLLAAFWIERMEES